LKDLRINGDRLWNRIHSMAKIGATPNGGVHRLALSQEDKRSRDLFIKWGQSIDCKTRVDAMGNIFVRLEGTKRNLPPILFGSHLDSQPTGGKYDGSLGVLAGLELLETLRENSIDLEYPLELVSWTSEEGSRFSPAMISSGVFGGVFSLDYAYSIKDKRRVSLKEALEKIDYLGSSTPFGRIYSGFFELHIEQGPILEKEKKSIGVVKGVQGIRWYELSIKGQEVHAGPFPMKIRRDPVRVLPKIISALYHLEKEFGSDTRITIGDISVHPGVCNTVPGEIKFTLDLRHPNSEVMDGMNQRIRQLVENENQESSLYLSHQELWYCPPAKFDLQCINAVKDAAKRLNYSFIEMFSGAGHDAVYLSRVTPTAMIFIPCKDGISHNEKESITRSDAIRGTNVLLHSILNYINQLKS